MRPHLPLALSACLLWAPTGLTAQSAPRPAGSTRPLPANARGESQPTQLPITHVSLYKSGVGFFEHTGHVTGDQAVSIDLTTAQLNDVLQSLTAIDLGGGHITGAGYNSTTPLAQQLRALPLSIGEEPTQQTLYDGLRGARVEITGSGAAFNGRILALEARTPPAGDNSKPATERRLLTVVGDTGGVRTIELAGAVVVRLLDASLRTDLNSYLAVLDAHRSESVRHLTLTDRGTGTRDLRVSFLSEVPVWKSTYRILFTDPPTAAAAAKPARQTATLQGLSVIDNTTGEDWNHVELSLIAGSPQSFLQPLAQPIYSRRPEIPIAQDAQLTPQTHDSADQMEGMGGPAAPQAAGVAGMADSGGAMHGIAGGILSGGSGNGFGPGAGATASARSVGGPVLKAAPPKQMMVPYETVAADSTVPNATTAAFDDYFAYNLTDPVTIPRNGSALVPILQTKIDSERVTLWSPGEPTPLRALWITNSSNLTLDRGSFSIIEDGAFGGEGLLETIHPGERRLLSYAADQAVRVSVDSSHDSQRVTSIAVSKGILRASTREVADVEYLVHNAAPESRVVIVEQPRRQGWTLDSPVQPSETTSTAYRFRVPTAARETVRLHIGEGHTIEQRFRLTDSTQEQLSLFLRNADASPALLQKLEPIFAAKRAVAALDSQVADKQNAITQLVEDQKRLRDNLSALKGSAEERTLARRYTTELNQQEDTLAMLRRDLASLEAQQQAANADLANRIDSLSMDEKLAG